MWRCCRCLPLGFSSAVCLAQQATTAPVVKLECQKTSCSTIARTSASCTGRGALSTLTTSGSFGKDRGEVNLLMEKICRELCSRGLLAHELCLASRCCDILGGSTNWMEKGCELAAALGTYEKLRLALQWILDGQMLERVMGHVSSISLVRRPLLSAFASVQKFQRAHYSKPAFFWASCQSELKHFSYAMPLLESDWSLVVRHGHGH